ncbi:MAG: hypothetical protein NC548_02305 [Lachnospiraceae bacterium]|nr:hypothetical protein [Lachnospiraceae bacterium]
MQVKRHAVLIFLVCVLAGCAKDSSDTTKASEEYKEESDFQEEYKEEPGVQEDGEQDMPQIKHIIIGTNYHIALCENGTVWSWGNNDGGKLGVRESAIGSPQRIAELEDIIKIVDGGENIFALTESGEVYCWGRGPEAVRKERVADDNIIYTPLRLEELSGIVDIDAKNNVMFALDESGGLYSLGLYLYNYPEHKRSDLLEIFSGHEELGKDIAGIVAGAGFYHYFIRTDGTIFSVMDYENDGYPLYAFIFPAAGSSAQKQAESYYRPEELENIVILNEQRKEGYLVYYNLSGVNEIEMAGSDMYTLFVSRTDGTLWYWNSDRIKYHDNAFALIDPESAEESTDGSFVQVDIREILELGEEAPSPYIVDIQSGMENTVFLTSDGSVFISRYEAYQTEDVSYFDRNNANPQNQSSVRQIKDMELKKLVFERLTLTNIASISSDGKGNFAAVDTNGVYFHITEESITNRIAVYRIPYGELDCDFKEGDYLAIEDAQNGSVFCRQ